MPSFLRTTVAVATLLALSACAMHPKKIEPLQPDAATRDVPMLQASHSALLRTDLAIDQARVAALDQQITEMKTRSTDLEQQYAQLAERRKALVLQ